MQKAKRHKQQQYFIRLSYLKQKVDIQLPCTVLLSRLSPRLLDDDNLRSALKYVRDEISELILGQTDKTYTTKSGKIKKMKGRWDSDPRITWLYEQKKNPIQKVCIKITHKEREKREGKL
jgi:hypothetical protein